MTGSEKIRMLLAYLNISASDLARKMGTSPQALNQKMKRDTFTLQDLQSIADLLNVKFEGNFILPNGEKI